MARALDQISGNAFAGGQPVMHDAPAPPEARMNMTPAERKARPPWTDYDVPEANQIVKFDANNKQAAAVPAALDMMQSARMQRAREMGFDTDAFHYTRSSFDEFDPRIGQRGASFLAATPDGARLGGQAGSNELRRLTAAAPDSRPSKTMDLKVRGEAVEGLGLSPDQKSFYKTLPESLPIESWADLQPKVRDSFGNIPNWLYDDSVVKMPDGTTYRQADLSKLSDADFGFVKKYGHETLIRGDVPAYSYENAVKSGRDVFGRKIAHYGPGSDEVGIAKRVNDSGMGGYLINDESGVSIAVTDPSNIRSVNAAFDPAKAGSANLLAANPFAASVPLTYKKD
ncbi:MAG TPA: hypothetical protein VMX97_12465 [Hyphomicrobiaceae bacterium]|nr:hypothetical protein [Hyphomicrobiaceae bacterium]